MAKAKKINNPYIPALVAIVALLILGPQFPKVFLLQITSPAF